MVNFKEVNQFWEYVPLDVQKFNEDTVKNEYHTDVADFFWTISENARKIVGGLHFIEEKDSEAKEKKLAELTKLEIKNYSGIDQQRIEQLRYAPK